MLRRRKFFQGRRIRGADVLDIAWLDPSGREMTDETWSSPDVRCLGVRLNGDAIDEVDERGERDRRRHAGAAAQRRTRTPCRSCCRRRRPEERWETLIDTADPWLPSRRLRAGDRYRAAGTIDGGPEAELPQGRPAARRRTGDRWGCTDESASRDHDRRDMSKTAARRLETAMRRRRAADSVGDRRAARSALQRASSSKGVQPEVDGGRFPIKRTVGRGRWSSARTSSPTATMRSRRCCCIGSAGDAAWHEMPMDAARQRSLAGARSRSTRLGATSTRSKAGSTASRSWRHELSKKFGAGAGRRRASCSKGPRSSASTLAAGAATRPADEHGVLAGRAAALARRERSNRRQRVARGAGRRELADADGGAPGSQRGRRATTACSTSTVERERARFGAWYEMFPRSAGHRSDAQRARSARRTARLPYVASMGFDVLYLPPIHPIGRSFRKGRNNALTRRPGRSGQPVGDRRGGGRAHGGRARARHARRLRSLRRGGAAASGSRSRSTSRSRLARSSVRARASRVVPAPADGTIKYAENPPKKYQDIYPFDFETRGLAGALGRAEATCSSSGSAHGVTIFRVDNPHTKPFRVLGVGDRRDQAASTRTRSSWPRRSRGRR